MCEASFTDGDWKILDGYQVGIDVEFGDGFFTIASCQVFSEGKANAHLIAAAPEMYAMLDEVSHVLGHNLSANNKVYIELISGLLAKARGEHV